MRSAYLSEPHGNSAVAVGRAFDRQERDDGFAHCSRKGWRGADEDHNADTSVKTALQGRIARDKKQRNLSCKSRNETDCMFMLDSKLTLRLSKPLIFNKWSRNFWRKAASPNCHSYGGEWIRPTFTAHLIHGSLGPHEYPPQWSGQSHWVSLPLGGAGLPSNTWFPGLTPVSPNGISIGLAVLQGPRTWPTDTHTDRAMRPNYSRDICIKI